MLSYCIEKHNGSGIVLVAKVPFAQLATSSMQHTGSAFVRALLKKGWWEHAEGWAANVVAQFTSMAMANLYAEYFGRAETTAKVVVVVVSKPWWENARGWNDFVKNNNKK